MKIIILGTAYPYRGGLAAFNERLARQFRQEGHQVEIVTFNLQYPSFLFPGKTQFTENPAPGDLMITREINSCNPFNWIKTGRKLRHKKADMVIFAYWMSFMAPCFGTIARQIKKNHHTKCIALVHNMIPHEPTVLDKFFPKYFVKAMDAFVALSKSVIDDINRFDRQNKPKVWAPHPIYDHYGNRLPRMEALEKLKLPTGNRYVLFFGIIRAYKGLDLLLSAFSDERLRNSDIRLIVAGEFYEDANPYYHQIKALQIEDRVILHTHFIADEIVNRYFSAADLIAQPYKNATQSGVTQIAFHFEKPMLVTDVGGLAEIVPHGKIGYVVAPDAGQIADAIYDFFSRDRAAEFEQNIKTEKEKYSWHRLTNAMMELMK